jgi:aryl-alcohol dehydrogenase-like predicted oxidoreductase
MELRQLGTSTLRVSEVGLGGNTFGPPRIDEAASIRTIHAAMDLGINFVDTALGYGEGFSERYIGAAIAGRRDHWVIATKFSIDPPREGARNPSGGLIPVGEWAKATNVHDRIVAQCEESLAKLQTDHIDLYQLAGFGRTTAGTAAIEEALATLEELRSAGKIREFGTVGAPAWRLAEANQIARAKGTNGFVSAQNYYNILRRQIEAELTSCCEAYQLSLIPYAPLAGGVLTGKYRRGEPFPEGSRGAAGSPLVKRSTTDRGWDILESLEKFATERGRGLTELAVAWLLANPLVASVICGASNEDQVRANVTGATWKLSTEEKQELDGIAPREGDDGA